MSGRLASRTDGIMAGRRRQAGFTIIELLIATLIFSLVLLLITVGIMTFTKVYFKGLNQSKVQNAARVIIETVGQAIQFSGGDVTVPIDARNANGSQGFCVADKRFSFLPGYQLVDAPPDAQLDQTRHALVMDEPGNCGGLPAQDVRGNPDGTELLSHGMRVSKLEVEQLSDSLYRVTVRIVYGDNDLLYSPSNENDPNGARAPDAACRFGFSGAQFCATSELSTIVNKRVGQDEQP